jgi:hypothetical protein
VSLDSLWEVSAPHSKSFRSASWSCLLKDSDPWQKADFCVLVLHHPVIILTCKNYFNIIYHPFPGLQNSLLPWGVPTKMKSTVPSVDYPCVCLSHTATSYWSSMCLREPLCPLKVMTVNTFRRLSRQMHVMHWLTNQQTDNRTRKFSTSILNVSTGRTWTDMSFKIHFNFTVWEQEN